MRATPTVAGARFLGLGSWQSEHVVTNADLEKRVETDDAWIRSRVGIAERRIADADTSLTSMNRSPSTPGLGSSVTSNRSIDQALSAPARAPPLPAGPLQVHSARI